MKTTSQFPLNSYTVTYAKTGKRFTCRIRDKKTFALLATGVANTRAEALSIAQAALPELPKMPALFLGEMMTCRVCLRQELSHPDIESGWTAIQADNHLAYICPDCWQKMTGVDPRG